MKIKNIFTKSKNFFIKLKDVFLKFIKAFWPKLKEIAVKLWRDHKILLINISASVAITVCAVIIGLQFLPKQEQEPLPPPVITSKVGICLPEGSSVDTESLTALLQENGYESVISAQITDHVQLTQQVSQLIQDNVKLVIVQPFTDSAVEEILEAPQQAGVPVILVDYAGKVKEDAEGVAFISQDPAAPGLFQGELAKSLPDGGDLNGDGVLSYAVLTGSAEDTEVQKQLTGIRQSLSTQELLSIRNLEATQQIGFEHTSDLLANYGKDLEVIICGNAELSLGAISAVVNAGRSPGSDICVIASGNTEEILKLITDARISATVAQDNALYTNRVAQIAHAILSGEPYDLQYYANYYTVTGPHYE